LQRALYCIFLKQGIEWPSNCGKTNIMLSLIGSPNGLKFENISIY